MKTNTMSTTTSEYLPPIPVPRQTLPVSRPYGASQVPRTLFPPVTERVRASIDPNTSVAPAPQIDPISPVPPPAQVALPPVPAVSVYYDNKPYQATEPGGSVLVVILVIVATVVMSVGVYYIWESSVAKSKTESLKTSIIQARLTEQNNIAAQKSAQKAQATASVEQELGRLEHDMRNTDTNLHNLQIRLQSLADGEAPDTDPGQEGDEEHMVTAGSYQNSFINKSDMDRERSQLNELGHSLVQRRAQLQDIGSKLVAKRNAIANS